MRAKELLQFLLNIGSIQMIEVELDALFEKFRAGDQEARNSLFALLYRELKSLARRASFGSRTATLNTTMIVNEACLRLIGYTPDKIETRTHLLNLAALAMRQIVCDAARRRHNRGIHFREIVTEDYNLADESKQVLLVDEALTDLANSDPVGAKIVECKFFAGLLDEEVAKVVDLPLRTVQRRWHHARRWLISYMNARSSI